MLDVEETRAYEKSMHLNNTPGQLTKVAQTMIHHGIPELLESFVRATSINADENADENAVKQVQKAQSSIAEWQVNAWRIRRLCARILTNFFTDPVTLQTLNRRESRSSSAPPTKCDPNRTVDFLNSLHNWLSLLRDWSLHAPDVRAQHYASHAIINLESKKEHLNIQ